MTNNWDIAMTALQKGGLKQEDAEVLLVGVVNEMITASDACTGPVTVSVTDHERELFMRIVKGLSAGGVKEGTSILLVAMYATAVQERTENETLVSNGI